MLPVGEVYLHDEFRTITQTWLAAKKTTRTMEAAASVRLSKSRHRRVNSSSTMTHRSTKPCSCRYCVSALFPALRHCRGVTSRRLSATLPLFTTSSTSPT
jgi:hypothetical protein